MNKKYKNGRAREYRLRDALLKNGFDIVYRTAGSHGSCDLIAIDTKNKRINFIQSKPKSMSNNQKEKINLENSKLNNKFICRFYTISTIKEMK